MSRVSSVVRFLFGYIIQFFLNVRFKIDNVSMVAFDAFFDFIVPVAVFVFNFAIIGSCIVLVEIISSIARNIIAVVKKCEEISVQSSSSSAKTEKKENRMAVDGVVQARKFSNFVAVIARFIGFGWFVNIAIAFIESFDRQMRRGSIRKQRKNGSAQSSSSMVSEVRWSRVVRRRSLNGPMVILAISVISSMLAGGDGAPIRREITELRTSVEVSNDQSNPIKVVVSMAIVVVMIVLVSICACGKSKNDNESIPAPANPIPDTNVARTRDVVKKKKKKKNTLPEMAKRVKELDEMVAVLQNRSPSQRALVDADNPAVGWSDGRSGKFKDWMIMIDGNKALGDETLSKILPASVTKPIDPTAPKAVLNNGPRSNTVLKKTAITLPSEDATKPLWNCNIFDGFYSDTMIVGEGPHASVLQDKGFVGRFLKALFVNYKVGILVCMAERPWWPKVYRTLQLGNVTVKTISIAEDSEGQLETIQLRFTFTFGKPDGGIYSIFKQVYVLYLPSGYDDRPAVKKAYAVATDRVLQLHPEQLANEMPAMAFLSPSNDSDMMAVVVSCFQGYLHKNVIDIFGTVGRMREVRLNVGCSSKFYSSLFEVVDDVLANREIKQERKLTMESVRGSTIPPVPTTAETIRTLKHSNTPVVDSSVRYQVVGHAGESELSNVEASGRGGTSSIKSAAKSMPKSVSKSTVAKSVGKSKPLAVSSSKTAKSKKK